MYVSVDSQLEVSGPETRPMKVKDISALVQQTVDVDTLKDILSSKSGHDENTTDLESIRSSPQANTNVRPSEFRNRESTV